MSHLVAIDLKPVLSNFDFGRLQKLIVGMIWLSGSGTFIKALLQSDLILKMISRISLNCNQSFVHRFIHVQIWDRDFFIEILSFCEVFILFM